MIPPSKREDCGDATTAAREPTDVSIGSGADHDPAAILNVLDGAALSISLQTLRDASARGDLVVATSSPAGTVIGAAVLDGAEILAIAVRPGRRGQGIGTALVQAAAADRDGLVARFHPSVADFYRSLGFDCEPLEATERWRGVWVGGARE